MLKCFMQMEKKKKEKTKQTKTKIDISKSSDKKINQTHSSEPQYIFIFLGFKQALEMLVGVWREWKIVLCCAKF